MTLQQLVHGDGKELITAVREGLPFGSFTTLRDTLELSTDELAELLGIPRRTLTKRRKDGIFSRSESNAISRVARIYREAASFFETEGCASLTQNAPSRLNQPFRLFAHSGRRPAIIWNMTATQSGSTIALLAIRLLSVCLD
jgi:putative toxin-antitoxin system antitoxin component (TIGR02293 family)